MQLQTIRIGFLGTGRMATALATGFTRDLLSASQILGADPVAASREHFLRTVGDDAVVGETADPSLNDADIIFLAVKPQVMKAALATLHPPTLSSKLVVSVAAGMTISTLESGLPSGTRLIRVIPNTPSLIGRGACGVSRGRFATEEDEKIVNELLETVGVVENVPEKLLDAVTGLSGSGPAYVFQIIEALSDGGVEVGLPRDMATRLAAQTVAGAAEMVLQTGEHPGMLKDAVTSPGGTTIAAIHEMEKAGVRAALMNAVVASAKRSKELADP
ncbi:MAG: pyrroline-5-carboxylate reductase [Fuerstiella sp.]|nr:pyrroline-5-carboxylate reductase [Fuerstiella sp.]MDG2127390.1 pyrroline-5-carboxylate reductase [Fuerstiella sp.]